jgi:hypothetical protein
MRPLAAIGGAFGDILGGRLTLLAIVNLVLAYGPSLLLWGVFAFFPARYMLRRLTAGTKAL